MSIDGVVVPSTAVTFDEPLALDEHAARSTAGVIKPTLMRCQHSNQGLHHMGRRIDLTALLASALAN